MHANISEGILASLEPQDEVILKLIDSARDEIAIRIRMRDTLLAVYVTAVAATVGYSKAAFGSEAHTEALYMIPYLSLAFTLLVCYHHSGCASLAAYCAGELYPKLLAKSDAPIYERSQTHARHRTSLLRLRSVGQLLVLISPTALALAVNHADATNTVPPRVLYWWFGLVAGAASLVFVLLTHSYQRELQQRGA